MIPRAELSLSPQIVKTTDVRIPFLNVMASDAGHSTLGIPTKGGSVQKAFYSGSHQVMRSHKLSLEAVLQPVHDRLSVNSCPL